MAAWLGKSRTSRHGTYLDTTGQPLDRAGIGEFAKLGAGRASLAGGDTLARAALLRALRDEINPVRDGANSRAGGKGGEADRRGPATGELLQRGLFDQPGIGDDGGRLDRPQDSAGPAGEGVAAGSPMARGEGRAQLGEDGRPVGVLGKLLDLSRGEHPSVEKLFHRELDDEVAAQMSLPHHQTERPEFWCWFR